MTRPIQRPMKLLRALYEAQKMCGAAKAATTKVSREQRLNGVRMTETVYASADDVIEEARTRLHDVGLMVVPRGTVGVGSDRLRVDLLLVHVKGAQYLELSYEVQEQEWGSSAAAVGALACALRMLLCMRKEPERVVQGDSFDADDYLFRRGTERVVVPAPVLPKVEEATRRWRSDLVPLPRETRERVQSRVQQRALELRHRRPDSPPAVTLRREAGVAEAGPLSDNELVRYDNWLAGRLLEHPDGLPSDDGASEAGR